MAAMFLASAFVAAVAFAWAFWQPEWSEVIATFLSYALVNNEEVVVIVLN